MKFTEHQVRFKDDSELLVDKDFEGHACGLFHDVSTLTAFTGKG